MFIEQESEDDRSIEATIFVVDATSKDMGTNPVLLFNAAGFCFATNMIRPTLSAHILRQSTQ